MPFIVVLLVICMVRCLYMLFTRKPDSKTHACVLFLILGLAMSCQGQVLGKPAKGLKIIAMGTGCGTIVGTIQRQLFPMFSKPYDWTIVVACDDHMWHEIQSGAKNTLGVTDYAFSDITLNYTYVRGTTLVNPEFGSRIRPEFILAHEAGHIIAKCPADKKGEALADYIATQLLAHAKTINFNPQSKGE